MTERELLERAFDCLVDALYCHGTKRQTRLNEAEQFLIHTLGPYLEDDIAKYECHTCGEWSTMDPPDCPRGVTHCDIVELS